MKKPIESDSVNLQSLSARLSVARVWKQMTRINRGIKRNLTLCVVGYVVYILFVLLIWGLYGSGKELSNAIEMLLYVTLGILIFAMVLTQATFKRAKNVLRAKKFAAENGFIYIPTTNSTQENGVIFQDLESSTAHSVIEGAYKEVNFRIFNNYGTANRDEYRFGVIVMQLPRKMPHVILDSKTNSSSFRTTNLPYMKRSQLFRLEGDFNKHYDVYVPKGYERDALYFLTPEIMALMIDTAQSFDIEVVDNQLYVYGKEFKYRETEFAKVFEIIELIGSEFTDNTKRYADERVASKKMNEVSSPGRRLDKSRWPELLLWGALICIIVYMLIPE